MGRTPDAADGPRLEEAVIWEEHASDPVEALETRYVQSKGVVILEDGVVRGIGEGRENVWQPPVDARNVNTPPGSPVTGYRVIIGSSPTGDFAGRPGEIAQWNGTAWVFTVPKQGTITTVKSEDEPYKQTATTSPWSWEIVVSGKVKVSANDTTADYLLAKLAAGSRIAITELNDGGDEDAQISVSDEYQYDEDATTRSTTSTGWDLAHRLTTTALVGGTYRVGFYYTWSFSRTNRNFKARVLVDGTEEHYHEQIPTGDGSDQRAVASGFVEVSLGAGAINIDLEFSRESGGSPTSYIYVSRLEIVRVS